MACDKYGWLAGENVSQWMATRAETRSAGLAAGQVSERRAVSREPPSGCRRHSVILS